MSLIESNKKQVVTALFENGSLKYKSGALRGARRMFEVRGKASIWVKGALDDKRYEQLTLDLMRKCALIGLPVSELRRVQK